MAHQLIELVEQFCTYQRKQRGRTEGGVRTYRWNLEQFLVSVKVREGRLARIADLTTPTTHYTRIRPPQLKRAVAFYEARAERMLTR